MYSQYFNKREAEEILERVERGEDARELCEKIIYEPYEDNEILIELILILLSKLDLPHTTHEYNNQDNSVPVPNNADCGST